MPFNLALSLHLQKSNWKSWQTYNRKGNDARTCSSRGNFSYGACCGPLVPQYEYIDPQWCLENGAKHHMTPNAYDHNEMHPYGGKEMIVISNGENLPSTHYVRQ